jgi:VWFA-related protein
VIAKNGTFIRDLAPKEFWIWEDNKEQTIKSFAFESSQEAAQPRSLVLFFDESSMEASDQIPALQSASRFIDAETGPNRRMAVVGCDGVQRVRHNFTDNAGRLKDALPGPASRVTEAEQQAQTTEHVTGRTIVDKGSIDDTGSHNMLQSLRYLGTSLGVLPGRKIAVVFAGRILSSSSQKSDLRETIDACNKSGVAVYPVDVRPVSAASIDTQRQALNDDPLGRLMAARNSAPQGSDGPQGDTADADRGPATAGADSRQLMSELAGRTGGFVIRNANDLLGGLQAVAGEQDRYYALTFTPPESKEGTCHTLRVKVDRAGTTVRARNSYCTAKALDLLAGTNMGKDLEKRAAETQAGNAGAQAEGSVVRGQSNAGAQAEGSVVRGQSNAGAQAEGSVVRRSIKHGGVDRASLFLCGAKRGARPSCSRDRARRVELRTCQRQASCRNESAWNGVNRGCRGARAFQ